MAASYVQIGEVQKTLGNPAQAEKSYREALRLRREIGDRARHEPDAHRSVIASRRERSAVRRKRCRCSRRRWRSPATRATVPWKRGRSTTSERSILAQGRTRKPRRTSNVPSQSGKRRRLHRRPPTRSTISATLSRGWVGTIRPCSVIIRALRAPSHGRRPAERRAGVVRHRDHLRLIRGAYGSAVNVKGRSPAGVSRSQAAGRLRSSRS